MKRIGWLASFEQRHEPLLPRAAFFLRLARHIAAGLGLIAAALSIGVLGYHFFEGLPWVDAVVNAAMILGGMGPVDALHTVGGKVFASIYALFSGLLFLVVAAVLFAPLIHRLLHRFHLDIADDEPDQQRPQ